MFARTLLKFIHISTSSSSRVESNEVESLEDKVVKLKNQKKMLDESAEISKIALGGVFSINLLM